MLKITLCTVKESAAQQVDLQPVYVSSSEATASYNGTKGPSIIIKRKKDGSVEGFFGERREDGGLGGVLVLLCVACIPCSDVGRRGV